MFTKKIYLKFLLGLLLMVLSVPLAQAKTLDVANGTETNNIVPVHGYYYDSQGKTNQMIYPESMLEDMKGSTITGIKFYCSNTSGIAFSGGKLTFTIGTTTQSTFSSATPVTITGTVSTAEYVPTAGDADINLTFDTPFEYTEGNIIIQAYTTTSGTCDSYGNYTYFYGQTQASASYSQTAYYGGAQVVSFLPKTTFTYEAGEAKPYDAKVTPENLDFGTLLVGGNDTKNVTIQNKGTQDLPYSITSLAAPFSTTATSGTIAAGADPLSVPVTFAPTATGTFEDDIVISFPGTELADVTVHVTGSASDAICDGTGESNYLPIYGYGYDYTQKNQMIYPASLLTKYVGQNITALKFYTKDGVKYSGGSYNVSLGTTTESAFTSATPVSATLTPVKTGLTATDGVEGNELTITFDEPFLYEGNNLVVDFEVVTKGTCDSYSNRTIFIGENQSTNTAYYSYVTYGTNTSANMQQFLPKIEITAESGAGAVTVNPAALTFGGETFYIGSTEEKTFTVTNTTADAVTITMTGDNVFTFSPASVAAGATETITVTYAPTAAGTQNATLAVGNKTVTLTGTAAVPPTPTITASVNELTMNATVGTPATSTFTVTGANLEGDITVAATGEGFSVQPTTIAAAEAAEGVTVTVTYNPAAAGNHNGAVTLTSTGAENVTVSLTGSATELPDYDISSSEPSGVHNFGDVFTDGTATWSITLTNNGKNAVTPTITGLAAPFSTTYTPAALASGESVTITFTFAPTEYQAYGPQSVVITFPETEDFQFDYTLRGNGIENTGTLPPSFYDGITYNWTDSEGTEHTSTLSEIATDPDQMIALMREVYTNKNLPGPYYRGYDADGNPETNYPVAYPAIGTVSRFGTFGVTENYTYDGSSNGWNIPHDEANYPFELLYHNSSSHNYYKALNGNEYKPNEEGLTLLLVEMKDGVTSSTVSNTASLRNVFSGMFKSVRVIPNSKRVTKNGVEGTLFKIDCDKMNRFFFLGKGRLRLYNDAYVDNTHLGRSNFFIDKDNQTSSSLSITNVFGDNGDKAPFYEMFEQFSPVSLTQGTEAEDIYQELINMASYPVEHDCEYIPWASASSTSGGGSIVGHEFNMYGKASLSEDCQDVRDLMFFVPDQRMKYWDSRDKGGNDKFVNYYEEMAPTMGLYVIRQNEITGEKKTFEGNENNYELHLTWDSNLTDFVPADKGVYYIYQVNDDGTYTLVGTTNSQTKELYVNVAMQSHGQQVTYVIQGQDNTQFLSLQMSNEESFIIPGTDENEVFQLDPNADIYSRFDPAQVTNFYANGMQIKVYPGVATSIYAGKTLNYYRKSNKDTDWTLVGTAAVNSGATQATVSMVPATQRQQSEYKYGYQANESSVDIATDAHGYNVFGIIYDNFKASVEDNNHPDYYNYKVEVAGEAAHSNEITIRIYKTAMSTIAGEFTKDEVDGDDSHTVGIEKTAFDVDVQHSSKTEILRYDAYRWLESVTPTIIDQTSPVDDEQDIAPNGIAGNQGEYYTVAMNSDYVGDNVYVSQGETNQATFEDSYPAANPNAYIYAPVVETFTGRGDYNTYGAPLQATATGKTVIAIGNITASNYDFKPKYGTTDSCRYYSIPMTATVTIPSGYNIYMVRAWRLIDESVLGEVDDAYADRVSGDYMFEKIYDASAGQGIPLGSTDISIEGSHDNNALTGTFGAKKLKGTDSFNAKFIVRAYFTKNQRDGSQPYYITETTVEVPVTSSVATGVFNVNAEKQVAGVKYYNLAGMESDEPFSGVNIVVTRYTDGSVTSSKVMR